MNTRQKKARQAFADTIRQETVKRCSKEVVEDTKQSGEQQRAQYEGMTRGRAAEITAQREQPITTQQGNRTRTQHGSVAQQKVGA